MGQHILAKETSLKSRLPWVEEPLIASAPMRLIGGPHLAVAVSTAGGLGFLAGGTDASSLQKQLREVASLAEAGGWRKVRGLLPIGVGFITWALNADEALHTLAENPPAAVWLFAPKHLPELVPWSEGTRKLWKGGTQLWIQVGSVHDALEAAQLCAPDVLVLQGIDAGGHGLAAGAGIVTLLPEAADALAEAGFGNIRLIAAGGITEGRGLAAALASGAHGIVVGTRFLASDEAQIAKGYQGEVLRRSDGGQQTVRTTLYDELRGTPGWPQEYDARGIINMSYEDAQNGMDMDENKQLYKEAVAMKDAGWGSQGRLAAYAGTGIGLIKRVAPAGEIVREMRSQARIALERTRAFQYVKAHL